MNVHTPERGPDEAWSDYALRRIESRYLVRKMTGKHVPDWGAVAVDTRPRHNPNRDGKRPSWRLSRLASALAAGRLFLVGGR